VDGLIEQCRNLLVFRKQLQQHGVQERAATLFPCAILPE